MCQTIVWHIPKSVYQSKLSARSLIIGLICSALVSFIVTWAELVTASIQIGFLQLPPVVVGILFLLIIANNFLARFRFNPLSPQELAVIFFMMLVSAMISSRGLMEDLPSTLTGINYYANEVNKWKEIFFPHIKNWLVPWDTSGIERQEIVRGYYEGYYSIENIPWLQWLLPLFRWYILVLLVYFCFFCLAVLFRKQWIEGEKLSFPLTQLPIEMMSEGNTFLSNKTMWVGFAVPAIVYTLNGLQKVFPYLPQVNLNINLKQFLSGRPWDSVEYLYIYISFATIGFFYFLPTQLLFSFWFFYFLFRAQELIAIAFGVETPIAPHAGAQLFVAYETSGAFFVIAGYLFYIALPHLRKVFRSAFGKGKREEDEVLPYKIAFWGLLIAIVLIGVWCKMAGMAFWLALFVFIIYIFIEAMVAARSTAEGGMIMTEGCFTPLDIYSLFASPSSLGVQNLSVLPFMDSLFTRDLRGILITGFLDSFKIGDSLKVKRRNLAYIFCLAVPFSILVATFFHLVVVYNKGGLNLYWFSFRGDNLRYFIDNSSLIENYVPSNVEYLPFFFGGIFLTLFLIFMRARFWWWPFHPLGFALSTSWGVIVFWFPIFLAWLVKTFVLFVGGMRLFAKTRFFFLGLIFGEFTMAVLLTIYACLTNNPVPFFPWP